MSDEQTSTERLPTADLRKWRYKVQGLVSIRMCMSQSTPLELTNTPPIVRQIVEDVVAEFRANHPEGMPRPPQAQTITSEYMRKAASRYDEAIASQFTFGETQ